ncbi:oxidoreductase [Colletotrichum tabaci]|uniref:2,4-dienoyl-CoA reductase [(3E)-enoyl-CoA-producing] n=1 Tax=Colletotrichum tabaci TaxID=1209068 RepID=A0AAV9T2W4_9PEZI
MASRVSNLVSRAWTKGLFDGTVVFCTGGNGTICSAQVKALVYLGADACIIGRNVEKTLKMAEDISRARPHSRVLGIGNVDVRNSERLNAAVEECVAKLGAIDFVMQGLSTNAFKSVVDIDLLGSYNTVKATMPHLLASANRAKSTGLPSGGRIIFISATFHYTGMPYQAHVASAKAGVDALSASVALECGPRGVTSNVISPGGVEGTEGLQRLSSQASRESGQGCRQIPLGRYGSLREIADATVFLFGETGSYVTGHVLVVDGGAWRLAGLVGQSAGMTYPEAVLGEQALPEDIETGRRPKPHL